MTVYNCASLVINMNKLDNISRDEQCINPNERICHKEDDVGVACIQLRIDLATM